jgi:hypothetical protein
MDSLFEKLIGIIPRKLVATVIIIWLIADYAKSLPPDSRYQTIVFVSFIIIALSGIASHTLQEWRNPSQNGNGTKTPLVTAERAVVGEAK